MAKKIPGTRVLDETFKQTVTAVAVPLNHPLSLAFATKFMTEAKTNGLLRKAFDNNGLKDTPCGAKVERVEAFRERSSDRRSPALREGRGRQSRSDVEVT